MPKRLISPLNTFIVPELKPERTAMELTRKWGDPLRVKRQLELGTDDEMEHTPFRYIARIIASHHLWKDINYYRKH